jgi:hypothetical protein
MRNFELMKVGTVQGVLYCTVYTKFERLSYTVLQIWILYILEDFHTIKLSNCEFCGIRAERV